MAKFKITKTTTVDELKKQFADEIGGTLRVYGGRSQVEDDVTLVSIGAKTGELECRTSRTVGKFEEAFNEAFNLKVKVYTVDDWVQVLSGVTLESVSKIKRQARKADMEQFVAYKREEGEISHKTSQTKKYKTMKKYIAEVQYNEEYRFATECEDPQEFINHFLNRGSDLEVEDLGMTDTPIIERINIYETDEDGDILYDEPVAEWCG